MSRSILIIAALLVTFALPVTAQTIKQADGLVSFLQTHTVDLGQASSNFISMQAGLKENESISANMVYDAVTNVQNYFDTLYLVVSIYVQMADSRDQATVRKYLALLSNQSVKSADKGLQVINRELARLSSPAAISEVQKMRDLIIKIREEINRTVPSK